MLNTTHRAIREDAARIEADEFWEAVYQEDLAMRADPAASAEFDAEVSAWDGTLLDGLEARPWEEPRRGAEIPRRRSE